MMDTKRFSHLTNIYFDTRRNKRYGHDAMVWELSWVSNTVRYQREADERTLRILHNYGFLTSVPRWREILATEFKGRMIDHELCEVVIPAAEAGYSPYTYNNRKGKGAQAAINQLIEHIYAASEGYTKPCRIIKMDISGYFPNAWWSYAEECIDAVIDQTDREDKDHLKWLAMIAINANPAAHCEKRTPLWLWKEHIPPEKSSFTKPEGVSAAIGRLAWQTAMGLYINDDIIWINIVCGLLVVCFVDDIVMVVPEHLHEYALSIIPQLRIRFARKGIRLNEKKFYDQPYEHGVEFLGCHIKPFRIHLNDNNCTRAMERVEELNETKNKAANIDDFIASVNSYTGQLKNRTEHKRLTLLRESISPDWFQYVEWDEKRSCVVPVQEYSLRSRMNKKYHLKLKQHGKGTRKNQAA